VPSGDSGGALLPFFSLFTPFHFGPTVGLAKIKSCGEIALARKTTPIESKIMKMAKALRLAIFGGCLFVAGLVFHESKSTSATETVSVTGSILTQGTKVSASLTVASKCLFLVILVYLRKRPPDAKRNR
jgi:hypothetical protein